jgi:TIR domain
MEPGDGTGAADDRMPEATKFGCDGCKHLHVVQPSELHHHQVLTIPKPWRYTEPPAGFPVPFGPPVKTPDRPSTHSPRTTNMANEASNGSPEDVKGPAASEQAPRVFISYAWTSASHQQWVLDLATRLRGHRVDAVLDLWDLKPGHDKFQFMEQMVADPSVQRVLLICNATYATKANEREGGVGDETQIITPKVYANTKNEKFIPVVTELDTDGDPYLPTYLKNRMYVDMSSTQVDYDGYERLLRLIHGSPAFPKPALGQKPTFLSEHATTGSTTSPLLRSAVHALQEEKRSAPRIVREYLLELSASILGLRFQVDSQRPIDEDVLDAIRRSKAYRDEFLELLTSLCDFATGEVTEKVLFDFLERLLAGGHQQQPGSWVDAEFDGVRFATMEIFLYTVTVLLERDQTDVLRSLTGETYVFRQDGGRMTKEHYGVFWSPIDSIERLRKQRLHLNSTSPVADLLKERADRKSIPFEQIQQTDLLLFLRSQFLGSGRTWWPRTLVFLNHYPSPFEIFFALESKRRFSRLQAILSVSDPDEFRSQFYTTFPTTQTRALQFDSFWPVQLCPLVNLDNRPDK